MGAALIALALLAVPLAATAERAAPWTDAFRREPVGTEILGVPVASIDADWRRASPLEAAELDAAQRADMKRRELAFVANGDFNDDGHPDRAIVGTFGDRHGKTGRFVAIFTQYANRWTRAFRETVDGEPGFGALSVDASPLGRLRWSTCLACMPVGEIAWSGQNWFLVPAEPGR